MTNEEALQELLNKANSYKLKSFEELTPTKLSDIDNIIALQCLVKELIHGNEEEPAEFKKILKDNFWDLLA